MTDSSDFEPSTIPEPALASDEDDIRPETKGSAGLTPNAGVAAYPGGTSLLGTPPHAVEALKRAAARRSGDVPGAPAEARSAPVSETPSTKSLPPRELGPLPKSTDVNFTSPPPSLPDDSSRTMISSREIPQRGAHTTMQSVARPGPPPSQSWDERRIVHLEREVDQLVARLKLGEKRLRTQNKHQRWILFGVAVLTLVEVVHWVL